MRDVYCCAFNCHLFNENPGQCNPTCVSISKLFVFTFSNPESHSHFSLVNVVAVTFNMAVAVKIVANAISHLECTVNGPRNAPLGTIKGGKPTTATVITAVNAKVTSKKNMEGSVCVVLHELTAL